MEFQDMMKTELQKLYSVETQLVEALGTLASKAQNPQLKDGLETHRQQTQEHARRLETICGRMGWATGGNECKGMRAMIEEANELLSSAQPGPVTDAMIIAAAQKNEHVEIACYGTAITLANQMGDKEAADLLGQNLQDEKTTDQKLTQIAESSVNPQAVSTSGAAMR